VVGDVLAHTVKEVKHRNTGTAASATATAVNPIARCKGNYEQFCAFASRDFS
jgi:hypothetical protein